MRIAIDAAAASMVQPGFEILDFGAGDAPYRSLFTARGASYQTADFADADVLVGPNGRLQAPDASADGVASFQVLEHVRSVDLYLEEALRVLRPGGSLLLSTHGSWLYHPHPEDLHRWTRTGLVQALETCGFEITRVDGLVGPLAWTLMFQSMYAELAIRRIPLIGKRVAGLFALLFNGLAVLAQRLTPAQQTLDNACVYLVAARRPDSGGSELSTRR
jgi:SAM-dependent methyltransferase